jgi:hypothetical protein
MREGPVPRKSGQGTHGLEHGVDGDLRTVPVYQRRAVNLIKVQRRSGRSEPNATRKGVLPKGQQGKQFLVSRLRDFEHADPGQIP